MPAPTSDPLPGRMLTRSDVNAPRALVLMLHGGRADGLDLVDERSASWRRSRWMMSHIEGRLHRAEVSVWLLRYQVRGWNARTATPPSPVGDARWALEEVRRELGHLPVVLMGHSMGGRTAVAVADDQDVLGVVALAPWLGDHDPVEPLRGKGFAAAHGRRDHITSPRQTQAFMRRAEGLAASTELVDMGRAGHYMFRHVPDWNRFALTRSLALAGIRGEQPAGRPAADVDPGR